MDSDNKKRGRGWGGTRAQSPHSLTISIALSGYGADWTCPILARFVHLAVTEINECPRQVYAKFVKNIARTWTQT